MREVHLPVGATERELELAERVAVTMRSGVLIVCWAEHRAAVAPLLEDTDPDAGLGL